MDIFLLKIKTLPGMKLKCYLSYWLSVNNWTTIKIFRILTLKIKILLILFYILTHWFIKYLVNVLKLFY